MYLRSSTYALQWATKLSTQYGSLTGVFEYFFVLRVVRAIVQHLTDCNAVKAVSYVERSKDVWHHRRCTHIDPKRIPINPQPSAWLRSEIRLEDGRAEMVSGWCIERSPKRPTRREQRSAQCDNREQTYDVYRPCHQLCVIVCRWHGTTQYTGEVIL